ncbi:MAG TPA: hypothetical protein VFZ65_12730 [Planctomycetota bacterium]|nr:hypothetical protein [Planctomycetota bacterium]
MRAHHATSWLGLLAPLCAQAVLQVPATYPQIGAAIAAAQPGDIVSVASGTYAGFVCDKAVTIAAQPGAQVRVATLVILTPSPTDFHVPGGGMAKVIGLQFVNPQFFFPMQTTVSAGRVAFEDCLFEAYALSSGGFVPNAGLRIHDSEVWLRHCRCTGHTSPPPLGAGANAEPVPGLLVQHGFVAAVDCEFVGGALAFDGAIGAGDGVHAVDSSVHLVRCAATGGASISCFYPSGTGVCVDAGIGTWLVDSTITGGSYMNCPAGGDALRNNGTVPVLLTRTTATPGAGTTGVAIVGPVQADTALGLASPTAGANLGAPYRIDYQATPNVLVALFLSDHLVAQAPVVTVEPIWLPAGAPFVGLLISDATGVASFQTTIPNDPTLRFASLWLHAAAWPGPPLHAAPPIGGVIH